MNTTTWHEEGRPDRSPRTIWTESMSWTRSATLHLHNVLRMYISNKHVSMRPPTGCLSTPWTVTLLDIAPLQSLVITQTHLLRFYNFSLKRFKIEDEEIVIKLILYEDIKEEDTLILKERHEIKRKCKYWVIITNSVKCFNFYSHTQNLMSGQSIRRWWSDNSEDATSSC